MGTTEATLRMENVDVKEEWQDEDFPSVKFINKIQYVHSLEELEQLIPMEHVQIPECVLQYEEERIKARKERAEEKQDMAERESMPVPPAEDQETRFELLVWLGPILCRL
ncbi:hypothetical protein EK904_008451 [Melospiza melodia maxima]|nr:hypothetical protein EK904_008451 [Melospiza melodia maxima]